MSSSSSLLLPGSSPLETIPPPDHLQNRRRRRLIPLMEESLRRRGRRMIMDRASYKTPPPPPLSKEEEKEEIRRLLLERISKECPPVRSPSRRRGKKEEKEAAPKASQFRFLRRSSLKRMIEDRQRYIDRLCCNRFPIQQQQPQAAPTPPPPPPPPPAGFRFVTLEDEEEDQIMSSQHHLARLDLSASQFRFPWEAPGSSGAGGYEIIKFLSINEISSKLGITEIRDGLVCSNCHQTSIVAFDLKSQETAWYILSFQMFFREEDEEDEDEEEEEDNSVFRIDSLLDPKLPPCPNCCSSNLKPLIPENNNNNNNNTDYQRINWLFLFMGRMLGFCTVQQLDFFCKHSSTSSSSTKTDAPTTTGVDNKLVLLYRTYLTLCKQLYPNAPF